MSNRKFFREAEKVAQKYGFIFAGFTSKHTKFVNKAGSIVYASFSPSQPDNALREIERNMRHIMENRKP